LSADDFYARVYAVVRRIPRGRVTTYGHIALCLGVPRGARAVGWALRALGSVRGGRPVRVPWHRVVAAGGRLSIPDPGRLVQARLLRAEGVPVREGRVDLQRHGVA
jgi:methylated-DNA-protein-cysteine methyltransferase-like protein